MFAKFVTFCLCAVICIAGVTAQLHFGTYKIVNRASQSDLCFDDVGGPVYVSTSSHLCRRVLWALGPGYKGGFYTVQETGLNYFVIVNEALDSMLITNDGLTSFVVSPARGNDYTIKLPNSDLAWTVGFTTASHTKLVLQPENGGDTQLWTFVPISIDDTIGPKPFEVQAWFQVRLLFCLFTEKTSNNSIGEQTVYDFKAALDVDPSTAFNNITWTHTDIALGQLVSAVVYTRLDIVVANKFRGSGMAYGIGLSYMQLAGELSYNSEDTLLSADNDMVILSAGHKGGAAVISFKIDNNLVALMIVGGIGTGLTAANGVFVWSKN